MRSDVPGALVAVPTSRRRRVAGQTVLTGFSPQELTFIVGKHLAMYRGEHYIKTLFPTVTELTVLLFAGIKIVAPETPSRPTSRSSHRDGADAPRVHAARAARGAADGGEEVHRRGREGEHQALGAVRRLTARARASCSAATSRSRRRSSRPSRSSPVICRRQEKLKELILFSISDQYFALRAALGITISVGG